MKVVGIAGGTASGKTTLAEALARHLGPERATLLSHDRYYHPLPDALRHDPAAHNFDEPAALDSALMREHLLALRAGTPVDVPVYDFTHHDRVDTERLHPTPVVVVEGILILADPALRQVFDHRLFVHTADDIRLARRLRRDVLDRGRDVHGVLTQYLHTVRPMHETHVVPSRDHAHLVLDGTRAVDALVADALAHIDL